MAAPGASRAPVTLEVLLDATRDNDLEKFESVCDDAMKQVMTEQVLQQVSGQVSGAMKKGYDKSYFGVVNRMPAKTYYWKLVFKGGETPELLVELTMVEDKVAGFFLR